MDLKQKLTEENSWKQLEEYFFGTGSKIKISDLFQQDIERFNKFR